MGEARYINETKNSIVHTQINTNGGEAKYMKVGNFQYSVPHKHVSCYIHKDDEGGTLSILRSTQTREKLDT